MEMMAQSVESLFPLEPDRGPPSNHARHQEQCQYALGIGSDDALLGRRMKDDPFGLYQTSQWKM